MDYLIYTNKTDLNTTIKNERTENSITCQKCNIMEANKILIYSAVVMVALLIGIIVNICLFLAVNKIPIKIKKKPYFQHVKSLAMARIITGITLTVTESWLLFYQQTGKDIRHAYVLSANIVFLCYSITVINIAGIALDSSLAITWTFKYQRLFTQKFVLGQIITMWSLGISLGAIPLCVYSRSYFHNRKIPAFYSESDGVTNNSTSQIVTGNVMNSSNAWFITFVTMFGLLSILIVTIFVIYIQSFISHYHHDRQLTARVHGNHRSAVYKTVSRILVAMTFTVCWIPWMVLSIMCFSQETFLYTEKAIYFEPFLKALLFVNIMVDPFIYLSRMVHVRNGFHQLFCPRVDQRH